MTTKTPSNISRRVDKSTPTPAKGGSKKSRRKPKKAATKRVAPQSPKKSAAPVEKRAVGRPRKPVPVTELSTIQSPVEEAAPKVDWLAVKLRYSQGHLAEDAAEGALPRFESLRDLSIAFEIPLRTVEDRSAKEGWVEERLDFQAKLGDRLKNQTTKKLALVQAAAREEIHAGARLAVRKVVEKLRDQALPMSDLVGATTTLRRALDVTTEAADPEAGSVKGAALVGTVHWHLLRGLGEHAPSPKVIECIPEDDFDE